MQNKNNVYMYELITVYMLHVYIYFARKAIILGQCYQYFLFPLFSVFKKLYFFFVNN